MTKIKWFKFIFLIIKGITISLVLYIFLSIYPFKINGMISTIIIQPILITYAIWKGNKIIES